MKKRIHLIGIGGSGMSSIARVLLEQGFSVSGSDRSLSPLALELRQAGADVYEGHMIENVHGVDLVVRSSAIPDDNIEVVEASRLGIPVEKRQNFMQTLLEKRECIAVAGTHGKTTTAAMLAWSLKQIGLDPGYILGGVSLNLGNNAHSGSGRYFVIEADEYDNMFLGIYPQVLLLTNVEYDHPDFFPTVSSYHGAFKAFIRQINPGGLLVVNADDKGALEKVADLPASARAVTFGLSNSPDYKAVNLSINETGGYSFSLVTKGKREPVAEAHLQVPGEHNVRNALGVLAVHHALGNPVQLAADALTGFTGSGRRFEIIAVVDGITIIDDYAHHPSKVKATLAAARSRFPHQRIVAVWQPHTYSRTQTLEKDFINAFGDADQVIVTEVYAAREKQQGYSPAQLVERMNYVPAKFIPDLSTVVDTLADSLKPGDVMIVLSAGDANRVCREVQARLVERKG